MDDHVRPLTARDGPWFCEGPDFNRRVTGCDGGADLFRGRRARWLVHSSHPLCGTCKKRWEETR